MNRMLFYYVLLLTFVSLTAMEDRSGDITAKAITREKERFHELDVIFSFEKSKNEAIKSYSIQEVKISSEGIQMNTDLLEISSAEKTKFGIEFNRRKLVAAFNAVKDFKNSELYMYCKDKKSTISLVLNPQDAQKIRHDKVTLEQIDRSNKVAFVVCAMVMALSLWMM